MMHGGLRARRKRVSLKGNREALNFAEETPRATERR